MVGLPARKLVQEQASLAGFRLEDQALKLLTQHLLEGGDEDTLQRVFNAVDTGGSIKVTAQQVEDALESIYGTAHEDDLIQVISAFEVPKILYDPIRKCFYKAEKPPRLLGSAEDKMGLYIHRFQLLYQRLRRMKGWNKPAIVDDSNQNYVELTELKAMLGVVDKTRIVMGCITQTEDGRYSLEDLSASLPLDLSEATMAPGFITENSIVVAEGQLQINGSFKAHALGLPPIETREATATAAKGLDFFGGPPMKAEDMLRAAEWEGDNEDDRIVILSNVWLDQPDTLDKLCLVMAGFESLEAVPKLFVFMGNFQSNASASNFAGIRENFNALAALLRNFRRIREGSKFVFVPGPNDPAPADVLPRPPLPSYFTEKLAEELPLAVFSSNPCRVRYGTRHLVFFRADVEHGMRRQCLMPPQGDNTPEDMFQQLTSTLLQQSHLSPVPLEVQPVYWQHDHSLALYPLPHLLVLADCVPPNQHSFEGCECVNPGSFADGTFAAYVPSVGEVELCDVPDDD